MCGRTVTELALKRLQAFVACPHMCHVTIQQYAQSVRDLPQSSPPHPIPNCPRYNNCPCGVAHRKRSVPLLQEDQSLTPTQLSSAFHTSDNSKSSTPIFGYWKLNGHTWQMRCRDIHLMAKYQCKFQAEEHLHNPLNTRVRSYIRS